MEIQTTTKDLDNVPKGTMLVSKEGNLWEFSSVSYPKDKAYGYDTYAATRKLESIDLDWFFYLFGNAETNRVRVVKGSAVKTKPKKRTTSRRR